MDQETQIGLIKELLDLDARKSLFLDEQWEQVSLERYTSPEIFTCEREVISRRLPQIVAHVSELPEPGSFLTMEMAGRPLLLSRDESGAIRAFYNVCRHRGSRLVADASGCQQRFRCPYHAWTWNASGELIGVPHEKDGFPEIRREEFGLHALPCQENAGWVWVSQSESDGIDVETHLDGLALDYASLEAQQHVVFETTTLEIAANWKLIVEGGLESYHFRVAHQNTIAGFFHDNLSTYQCFGSHIRSILPRSNLREFESEPEAEWSLRKRANILYSFFPGAQFLVQEDHFVWIKGEPLAPDRTRLRISTMVPRVESGGEKEKYWKQNHAFTVTTLNEDFALAEGIQAGLDCGANRHLNFGRFEGALAKFNRFVDDALDRPV